MGSPLIRSIFRLRGNLRRHNTSLFCQGAVAIRRSIGGVFITHRHKSSVDTLADPPLRDFLRFRRHSLHTPSMDTTVQNRFEFDLKGTIFGLIRSYEEDREVRDGVSVVAAGPAASALTGSVPMEVLIELPLSDNLRVHFIKKIVRNQHCPSMACWTIAWL